jgi:hypothetical protein
MPVDPCSDAGRQHAREVARDAAAGHVGERPHVRAGTQLAHVVQVQPRRREHELRVEVRLAEQLADKREAVGVQPRGGKPEHDVAGPAARAVDQPLALDQPDAGAREIELLVAVDAR